jgi:hypothetical protein
MGALPPFISAFRWERFHCAGQMAGKFSGVRYAGEFWFGVLITNSVKSIFVSFLLTHLPGEARPKF